MPNRRKLYRNKSLHRQTSYRQKHDYYKRHRYNEGMPARGYTTEEMIEIMEHKQPDRIIAERQGRSVQAIQIKRGRILDRYD